MTVIVGYRPSPEASAALQRSIVEARLRETDLVVLHSGEQTPDAPGDVSLEHDLDALAAALDAAGVRHRIQTVQPQQDPADVIVAAVTGPRDLVVLGLRRRTPVGKLVTGSVAQRVILDADCAVLCVKATPGS